MPIHWMELDPALALSAHSEMRQDTVVVWLTFTNTRSAEASAQFGFCSFTVHGNGVGDSWNNGIPPHGSCPDLGYIVTPPGGQSHDRVVLSETGSSLRPTGGARPYRVRVTYRERETDRLRELDAGTVVF